MDSLDYKYKYASKQKRIIALQNNRQKPAKQEMGLFGGDWRWGKSWCYLTELQSYLDERLEKLIFYAS